jgi:hypothetical protein
MGPDHGAEQAPRVRASVHAEHAQDLKESQSTERGRRKVLVLVLTGGDYGERDARDYHRQVFFFC